MRRRRRRVGSVPEVNRGVSGRFEDSTGDVPREASSVDAVPAGIMAATGCEDCSASENKGDTSPCRLTVLE